MSQIDRAKYMKRLEVEAANHKLVNTQQQEFYERAANNEVAPIRQYSTTAEELSDRALQRDRAYASLQRITNPRDAGIMLNELQHASEIDAFNRFFVPFFKELRGQKNISPVLFTALWARYKDVLATTGDTGILFVDPGDEKAKRDELLFLIGQQQVGLVGQETKFKAMKDAKNWFIEGNTKAYSRFYRDHAKGDAEVKSDSIINLTQDDGSIIRVDSKLGQSHSKPYFRDVPLWELVKEMILREYKIALTNDEVEGRGMRKSKKGKKGKRSSIKNRRMDLLKGEIYSGNNNPVLVQELRMLKS